ncbi:MAG: Wzt carbohydrate-binding domain-containing protein, partial [Candidatus Omnitrophica bacterium]|nr:Wzt carbohydrate-binding domain-containing protein [Candidatus Omnitrophota bacterium]
VGTGFHPELTGRENVYLNGAILGMRKQEITRKFDEIVAFAEIEKFIETPVKRYSSGMYVRLAFAVAAHLEPEILLVDEVLAVGDIQFQKKCLGKMDEVAKGGRTVLFVSHNMGAVQRLCRSALWFNGGRLQIEGRSKEVIESYMTDKNVGIREQCWQDRSQAPGNEEISLRAVRIRDTRGKSIDTIDLSSSFAIDVEYEIFIKVQHMRIVVKIETIEGTAVLLSRDNYENEWAEKPRPPGRYISTCNMPGHLLNAGHYVVTVSAETPGIKFLFYAENVLRFFIHPSSGMPAQYSERWPGIVCPRLSWDVTIQNQEPR